VKQTNTRILKKQTKKQQKYFWSFCVLESRNKTRTTKKKKESKTWMYKVPTEYDV
jgi:hypothetical protein